MCKGPRLYHSENIFDKSPFTLNRVSRFKNFCVRYIMLPTVLPNMGIFKPKTQFIQVGLSLKLLNSGNDKASLER